MRRPYDPDPHLRRSIRLSGFDYSQAGAYFVTIVTRGRECLFGDVADGEMRLNESGDIAQACWLALPEHVLAVRLDTFIVMPNHVHGVFWIVREEIGAPHASPLQARAVTAGAPRGPAGQSVGSIVGSFKSAVSKRINESRGACLPVWQRNYYEHVIRDDESLNRIRQYILHNPARWPFDRENPAASAPEPQDAWRTAALA